MGLRITALLDRVRSSLFVVPTVFVLLGGALGIAMVEVDARLDDRAGGLPFVLTSTVNSAREVLGVVAGATITVAAIAFSVSLLVIQQAAAQYSPRIVHTLFRDTLNRRVMGLTVGTFTYCLMVLRAVRGSLDDGGEPVIPNVSVGVSVLLGVASVLAIVAFIDHSAHTMEVSQILSRVTRDTVAKIEDTWPKERRADEVEPPVAATDVGSTVRFLHSGWVQQLNEVELLSLVPPGGVVRIDTVVGRYAVRGTPLCEVWPPPNDDHETVRRANQASQVGPVRTMQQDPTYGVRQLADVALLALSPGVNDPTTAQDAIFHLADVLREALVRTLPVAAETDAEGRTLVRAEAPTPDALVELAFDEIRRTASGLPTVAIYLLEALHLVAEAVADAGQPERSQILLEQANLVLEGVERSDALPADREQVRRTYDRRFRSSGPTGGMAAVT